MTRTLQTAAATAEFGATLARALHGGLVIYLRGELGAGKTTLARGILQAMGVTERIKSPTYTLVEPYNLSKLYLYHFDFYRLRHPDEWLDAGFREHFNAESLCLVEWPEKAGAQLPPADLTVDLGVDGDTRSMTLSAHTEAGTNCLRRLKA